MPGWVLWDFNGTLLDDLDAAVAAVTDMLARRGRPAMTRERYYELIEVPISRYYEKLFAPERIQMSVLAPEFQEGYARHFEEGARLADGAQALLECFRAAGTRQMILSSFRRDRVERILEQFGIRDYFEAVLAADDDHSEEKITRARAWLGASGAQPEEILVIGDLVHDFEAAQALGAQCALVASGHQGREDLLRTGAPVYRDLLELYQSIHQLNRENRGGANNAAYFT